MESIEHVDVTLDAEEVQALQRIAVRDGRTVHDLVRQAVHDFVAQRDIADQEWRERLDRLVERVRSRIPPEITPEEIEADITAARAEVREAHRARRS